MTTFKLTIHCPDELLKETHGDDFTDYKLCFSFGVAYVDRRHHNVIAWQGSLAEMVQIEWEDKYMIAATKTAFVAGVMFTAATDITEIAFGHKYTLKEDWTGGLVEVDPNAPNAGFLFSNETSDRVSAILYKKVNGNPEPVFISPHPVFSKGQESITPTTKISLWLQSGADTGNMVDCGTSKVSILEFEGVTELAVLWTGSEFEKTA